LFPLGIQDARIALAALSMVLVPALLMVSTIRFRSVKAIDVGWRRSYLGLFLAAVAISLIAIYPRIALVVMAYTYAFAGIIFWGLAKMRRPHDADPQPSH
jgi:phosphatidylserine synthase